jgi:hypothetical protein
VSAELWCPRCGREEPAGERFCSRCGLPLVYGPRRRHRPSARERRARKINPRYTEGKLVRVASASNLAEAEFIEGLLLDAGIPCVLRSQIAGYAPLVGVREVLVAESAAQAAHEALEPRASV